MSIAELKSEMDLLSPEERRHLKAYLVTQDQMLDPKFREELTHKIDGKDSERWMSLDGPEKQLL